MTSSEPQAYSNKIVYDPNGTELVVGDGVPEEARKEPDPHPTNSWGKKSSK